MHLSEEVHSLVARVQTVLARRLVPFRHRRRGVGKLRKGVQISAPYGFVVKSPVLPGISHDELSVYREKALATRIGIAHADDEPASVATLLHLEHPPHTTAAAAAAVRPPIPPRNSSKTSMHAPACPTCAGNSSTASLATSAASSAARHGEGDALLATSAGRHCARSPAVVVIPPSVASSVRSLAVLV